MSEIATLNNSIFLNGSKIQAKIKVLDPQVNLEQANSLTKNRKDGYDTIGGKLEGKDVLVLAKHQKGILNSDQLQVNGKRLEVSFVENEKNTKHEFLKDALPSTAILSPLIGAVVSTIASGGGGNITLKSFAISTLAVGSVLGTASYFAGKHIEKKHDEKITNSITK